MGKKTIGGIVSAFTAVVLLIVFWGELFQKFHEWYAIYRIWQYSESARDIALVILAASIGILGLGFLAYFKGAITVKKDNKFYQMGLLLLILAGILSGIFFYWHKDKQFMNRLKIAILVDKGMEVSFDAIKKLAASRLENLRNTSPIKNTVFSYRTEDFDDNESLLKRIDSLYGDGFRQFVIVSCANLKDEKPLLEFIESNPQVSFLLAVSERGRRTSNLFWIVPDLREKLLFSLNHFAAMGKTKLFLVRSDDQFGSDVENILRALNKPYPSLDIKVEMTSGPLNPPRWNQYQKDFVIIAAGGSKWLEKTWPMIEAQQPKESVLLITSEPTNPAVLTNVRQPVGTSTKWITPVACREGKPEEQAGLIANAAYALEMVRSGWQNLGNEGLRSYDMSKFVKYYLEESPRPVFENGMAVYISADMQVIPRHRIIND